MVKLLVRTSYITGKLGNLSWLSVDKETFSLEGENYLDQSDQPPNFWSFFYLNYSAPHPEQALLPQQEGFISHPIVFSIICHRSGKSWVAG